MINEIRSAIAKCGDEPEELVYEALMEEASGWKMRLEELQDDET